MFIQLSFLIIFLCQTTFADKLIQAQILYRHGARNQIYFNWGSDEYKDVMEYLTAGGMRQQYVLGQWLRSRYIEQFGLISPELNQNEIIIRSTDVNRTIMSAVSSFYGLYPPGTGPQLPNIDENYFLPPIPGIAKPNLGLNSTPYLFQPVPVHVVPDKDDYLLRSYGSAACPKNKQYQSDFKKTEIYNNVTAESQWLFKAYGEQMGYDQSTIDKMTIESIMQEYDTYVCDMWAGYKLPPNLLESTLEQMKLLYPLQLNLALFQTQQHSNLLSTPFFQELISNMYNKLNETKSYNFHFYMAHDTTISMALNALHLTSTECLKNAYENKTTENCITAYPLFATNLIFELWQDENKSPYLMIMHNGTYYPPCWTDLTSNKCPLHQFNHLMSSQYQDYYEGCGLNQVEIKTVTKTPKWVWVLLGLSIATIVISLGFGCFAYFKWKRLVAPEEQRLTV